MPQTPPITIGLHPTKNVFQGHAVAADGTVACRRKIRCSELREFFTRQPPCRVGRLTAFGHTVRLMPATCVKRGKSHAIDAEAICEALTRPTMRFVPAKSVDQQAIVMLHRTRDLPVRQRTMLANALRGCRGIRKMGWMFTLGSAVYNPARLPKLLAAVT